MANKKEYETVPFTLSHSTNADEEKVLTFSNLEKINACKIVHKNLIKLLFLIEAEKDTGEPVHNWFVTFMLDLRSTNSICDCKLTKVLIKMNSLYEKDHYKELEHGQIKRQIMESRGIVEHLIAELEAIHRASGEEK